MLIAAPDHVAAIHAAGWRADPYPLFAELRRNLPVARLDWPMRGAGDWLVTRHADITAALRHPALAISRTSARGGCPHRAAPLPGSDPNEPLQQTVLTTDGADYVALRARTAKAISGVTPAMEQCVDTHIARITREICGRARFDLVGDFARPICEAIWSDLMVIDSATMRRLSAWSALYLEQGFIFGHGPVKASAGAAVAEMRAVLRTTLNRNVAVDRVGFLSAVAREFPPGEDATSAINTAVLLTAAMLQSVTHALVNCLAVVIARPADWRRVRAQPALVPQMIEECLRFDGPSQAVGRIATADLCLAGQPLARGAFVRLAVASANRDEARFSGADRCDIDRAPLPHLAFGHALHSCAGARLARLILRRGLSSLSQACTEPMIDSAGVVREVESSLRGYVRVPILAAA